MYQAVSRSVWGIAALSSYTGRKDAVPAGERTPVTPGAGSIAFDGTGNCSSHGRSVMEIASQVGRGDFEFPVKLLVLNDSAAEDDSILVLEPSGCAGLIEALAMQLPLSNMQVTEHELHLTVVPVLLPRVSSYSCFARCSEMKELGAGSGRVTQQHLNHK